MMRNLLCTLALLLLASSAFAKELMPSQIYRDINLHGARATVQSLDRSGKINTVLTRIASGNSAWVRLAPGLAQGTDAGNSTGLTVALAKALPRNPAAVLAILDKAPLISAGAVCGVPFIEPSAQEVREYLDKTIPAVTRIKPSHRVPSRSLCLEALHRARAESP
jgi:hypothetical protein